MPLLAKIKIELNTEKLDYRKSSNLQGVLFENISEEYAAKMHQQSFHPYSQNLIREDGRLVWQVSCLTEESYREIIMRLAEPAFSSFVVNGSEEIRVEIAKKDINVTSRTELLKRFQNIDAEKQIKIKFMTPTAFRQNGMYTILPELRLLYQSLMMRYSATSSTVDMNDEDMLNDLVANTFISRHRLQSRHFPMQGTLIPGFTGSITVGVRGSETIARFARLLLEFGEYSGVGVKTSMGMGAIRIGDANNEGC